MAGWYWNATTPKCRCKRDLASQTIYHAAGGGIRVHWRHGPMLYYYYGHQRPKCAAALSHEWWVLKTLNPKEQKGLPYHSCPSMWGLVLIYHSLLDSFENQRMGSLLQWWNRVFYPVVWARQWPRHSGHIHVDGQWSRHFYCKFRFTFGLFEFRHLIRIGNYLST